MQTGNITLDGKVERAGARRLEAANLTVLPAFVVAFLPKCPLCLMGILSAVGLSSSVNADWLFPLSLLFLGGAVFPLMIRARRRNSAAPFVVGLSAAILILLGKFYFALDWLAYIAMAALFVASFWSSWQRRKSKAACRNECNC